MWVVPLHEAIDEQQLFVGLLAVADQHLGSGGGHPLRLAHQLHARLARTVLGGDPTEAGDRHARVGPGPRVVGEVDSGENTLHHRRQRIGADGQRHGTGPERGVRPLELLHGHRTPLDTLAPLAETKPAPPPLCVRRRVVLQRHRGSVPQRCEQRLCRRLDFPLQHHAQLLPLPRHRRVEVGALQTLQLGRGVEERGVERGRHCV
mmetsp:Transcript_30619/g.76678  ORF Transcript_30619/g.76678 Transcript_30619/m.76678 type:complete len:205 (-) Transcript_30619:951-1565(-)